MTLLLSNDDVDRLLSMRECIEALELAYRELAAGRGTDRRRSDSFVPGPREGSLYSLKSMDGIAPAFGVAAVRVDSDVVTWPTRAGNARREKVPAAHGRYTGLVLLFSVETGEPLAILPDGYLQRLRVGATNAIAADRLARPGALDVGLLGAGWQAGGQVMGLCAVRRVERIRCYSTGPEGRAAFAREWSERLGVPIEPVATPEAAVRGADVVLCATNTIDHVFFERWVEPGMHLSSIKRPEIEPGAVRRADVVVIHARSDSPLHVTAAGVEVPEASEGKGWKLLSEIDFSTLPELHDLVAGTVAGRRSDDDVTCFLNNIGRGYQFAAAGGVVYRKAKAAGAGREIPTEWLTEDVHP